MIKNGVRRGRTRFFALILALWGAVVVARLVQIQIAQGSRYRAKAQRQQERRVEIPGQRGSILDREGRELAVSIETTSIYAIPDDVRDSRRAADVLAPVLGMPAPEILEKLSSERGFVWLRRQLDVDAAESVRGLKLPGIHFVDRAEALLSQGPPRFGRPRLRGHRRRGPRGPRALLRRDRPGQARRARRPHRRPAQPLRRRRRGGPARAGGGGARPLPRLGRAVRRRARARRSAPRPPREVRQHRRHGSHQRRDPRDGFGAGLRPE